MLYALILAGGKGTRLYPLSRTNNPKQFLNIINDKSFLRYTVDRIKPIVNKENIFIVTNKDYLEKVKQEIPEINKDNIIVEPANKETATCIGLSAVRFLKKDKDATMIVLPSDHYIQGEKEFRDVINQALELVERKRGLVTLGISPTRPETGYGYIQMGSRLNVGIASYKVDRFLEKPNTEVAKDLLIKGNYLWNSGMFIWRADVYLRECEKYLPKMYNNLMKIYQSIGKENEQEIILDQYNLIEGISVDFGIMQKTRKAYVVKCDFKWDDIGSFQSLSRFLKEFRGNNSIGNAFMKDSENCCVFADNNLVIGFGVKDLIIVNTGDVVLVMDKSKDQELKHLVGEMKNMKSMEKYI